MKSVNYATASDGTALAWRRSGSGPLLVKPANWLTHLAYDDVSPIWSHWVRFLEQCFDFLRFDERGSGMSDRTPGDLDVDTWTGDVETVVAAARAEPPFVMLGVSQGAAIALSYAARHPDHVSRLILYGGYARGMFRRGDPVKADFYRAIVDVFRMGWDEDNPAFQEVFTSRFIPDAGPEERRWFNELCRRTVTPEVGAALLSARADIDVTPLLARVTAPVLVIQARDEAINPLEESRLLAQRLPNAELALIPGRNHILQSDEPGWSAFQSLVRGFCGLTDRASPSGLTDRERDVLRLICAAKSNKEIARELGVSEKTVRNHATHVFAKLGVSTRQQAILKMQSQPL